MELESGVTQLNGKIWRGWRELDVKEGSRKPTAPPQES
jgi:hypothetical protein